MPLRPANRPASLRAGAFTVVELLVVIAIIGLLASLLLAAVSNVRDAGARVACRSKLQQFGLALMNYEAAHGMFPLKGARTDGRFASVHARILPFVEAGAVSDMFNFSRLSGAGLISASPANKTAAARPVGIFICPSENNRDGGTSYFVCAGRGPHWEQGPTGLVRVGNDVQSLFGSLKGRRIRDISRGTVHTAAASERVQGDGNDAWMDRAKDALTFSEHSSLSSLGLGEPYRAACQRLDAAAGTWTTHESGIGRDWTVPDLGSTAYTHAMTPNSRIADCGELAAPVPFGAVTARSGHSGGVHTLFADGHVEFVADAIDAALWSKMSCIDESPSL
jgi:prepilin-type processing-associated H-X9-DG protein